MNSRKRFIMEEPGDLAKYWFTLIADLDVIEYCKTLEWVDGYYINKITPSATRIDIRMVELYDADEAWLRIYYALSDYVRSQALLDQVDLV